jgi:2,4-dienoyl-CoA reductase-like NADH-dependent reductase (Old Yellow Enzyme family)/thioredoxin reductase
MQYENLFSPIKIGNKTAKNRIVFPAHGIALPFMDDGTDGNAFIAYQAARAKGGCALNIIGNLACYDVPIRLGNSFASPPEPAILVPKLRRLADALHERGSLGLVQLYIYSNTYLNTPARNTWGFTDPVAQSESVAEWRDMDDSDLNKKVDSFVKYALLCREGNMDGIEVHACHADMVQQSWSKWSNQRTDKWGEPMFFATEIVNRIRAATGKDFIISVRMTGDDFTQGGMDNTDNQKVAQALEATGSVDLLDLSFGNGGVAYSYIIGSMYIPAGSISIPLASGIKQAVKSIPVVATGRINDPALAEKAIADGHCDMVGLVRGQLADPEFGNKAREGKEEDIRLCIACNQGCWDGGLEALRCTQNAVVGQESSRFATIKPAGRKKKVIIVGAGPAGMEAARVAAIKGHDVTVFEKENQPGGQINVLSKAPGRDEFNQVTRYLTIQNNKLGVHFRLGLEATPEMIERERPDAVIIATGSRPYVLPVPGGEQGHVASPSQILKGEVIAGQRVVVYESTGLQEGPTVADYLAEKGKQVELLTHFAVINTYWGLQTMLLGTHLPIIWTRLKGKGVVITPLTTIKKISGKTVTVADVITGEEREIRDIDTVVMATGYRANNTLYKALKGKVKELYRIGDCSLPRRALDAIFEGYMTAFDI